jgi:hypothetical protein
LSADAVRRHLVLQDSIFWSNQSEMTSCGHPTLEFVPSSIASRRRTSFVCVFMFLLASAMAGKDDSCIEQSMINETDPNDGTDDNTASRSLPKTNTEYGKKTYWDERFATESEYEWLASWEDVAYLLKPFISPESSILVVGCGNSSFSSDLYDAGYTDICSLDYSEIVINAMKTRNETQRPEMTWLVRECVTLQAKMVITLVYSLQYTFLC